MGWFKRDRWNAAIALAGFLLLLVLMVWVQVSAADAYEGVSGFATPVTGTVQATPTIDATVTALNKEKLQHEDDWWWGNGATILSSVLSTLVVVLGALIGFRQWSMNRTDTRNKERDARKDAQDKDLKAQAEERFKTAVTALGDEKEGTQIGGAILLRSFLNKSDEKTYGRYYTQIFDLAVAYLRLPRTSHPPEDPTPPPLCQVLINVFKEAFPLAHDKLLIEQGAKFEPRSLDASHIHLDNAFLWNVDLDKVWMPWATLGGADLSEANLKEAALWYATLNKAKLKEANLSKADLGAAKLIEAELSGANLSKALLWGVNLTNARLCGANLSEASLWGANLTNANLTNAKLCSVKLWKPNDRPANLTGADLRNADLRNADLSEVNIEKALPLDHTDLRGVKGLTKEQLEACKAKGALIDEDTTTN